MFSFSLSCVSLLWPTQAWPWRGDTVRNCAQPPVSWHPTTTHRLSHAIECSGHWWLRGQPSGWACLQDSQGCSNLGSMFITLDMKKDQLLPTKQSRHPDETIWKPINQTWCFMDVYQKGLTGKLAAWAVKKQKSHHAISKDTMTELDSLPLDQAIHSSWGPVFI